MNERITLIALLSLLAAVLFVIFNPFGWFAPPHQSLPPLDDQRLEALELQFEDGLRDPHEAVLELFEDHSIVLLGELGGIRDEVIFTSELVGMLPQAGVRHLGLEHLLAEDQEDIDLLITAPVFDEKLAERLLFNRLVTWGYEEYRDLLKKSWEIHNSDLGPFRVLGLNVHQDYSGILRVEDFRDPVKLRAIMSRGNPDEFMAEIIGRELVDKGFSALIFAEREKSFSGFLLKSHALEMTGIGIEETRQMGKILSDRYGQRFGVVLFHSPWPTNLTSSRAQYPVNGYPDALLDRLEEKGRLPGFPFGLSVNAMPALAGVAPTGSDYSIGYNGERDSSEILLFGAMADLYIILDRHENLSTVTPIEGFITEDLEEQALENFPGSRYEDADRQDVQGFIRRFAQDRQEVLRGFGED